MAQDEDIMTPVVNIYTELKELKASINGLTTDLNAAKNELEEQKSLIQDLQKQIKGKFSKLFWFGYCILDTNIVVKLQPLPFSMNKHYSHFLGEM